MVSVRVKFTCKVDGNKVRFYAAHPPDFHLGFAGSCLPFADESQAMHNTPTSGIANVDKDGYATIRLEALPNSYYQNSQSAKRPPTLHVVFFSNGKHRHIKIKVADSIPHRDLFSKHLGTDIVNSTMQSNRFQTYASGYQRLLQEDSQ